jgi:hypothetical protein
LKYAFCIRLACYNPILRYIMQIKVAIENNMEGRSIAWLLDYPGCFAYGSEEAEALIRVPQALIAFKGWLEGYTNHSWLSDLGDFDIRLVETFRAYKVDDRLQPDEKGDLEINAWFHYDWLPLTAEEMRRGLQVVEWAHNDLLEMTVGLSNDVLDRTYPDQRWSIRGIVEHVANAEWWYLSRLGLANGDSASLPEEMNTRVQATLDNMHSAMPGTIGKEIVRGVAGEIWSPRKIIRRACWHALDHCQHIHQLITRPK